jgi:hypothetical protein
MPIKNTMKAHQLLTTIELPPPNFSRFERKDTSMPPLNLQRLELTPLIGQQRSTLHTPTIGTASLVLRYKGKEGAVTSITELEDGQIWDLPQVQGARSSVAFRVATTLRWEELIANRISQFAEHPNAEVRHLTMPPFHMLDNIEHAASEKVERTYATVRTALKMRFSEELGIFIVDIER